MFQRPLAGRAAGLGHGRVGGAIGIIDDVDDGMLEQERMQCNGGAEQGNNFQLRLQAVDVEEWGLIGSFATVDGQVASIHAQAERDGVQFSEFDAAAGEFLHRRDHTATDHLLKGIGGDVPGKKGECNQAENAEEEKEAPQDAPALGRNGLGQRFGQRFCSPALDSGVRIWLPERRLASHPESSSFSFCSASKSLIRPKTSVSGAAPLPGQVAADFARRLPHVEIAEGYGCTETAAIIATSPVGAARAGSVGRPAPGVAVRIERPDATGAGPGEDGEICVRGPMVMTGYWHAPAETAEVMRGGWLHTGDVGHLDADGYLYIVDRIKDLIIRGGYNVYPRDIEDVLVAHPDVVAAAVVGKPDAKLGEEVVAFVQLRAGATTAAAELVDYARGHLSAVKYPRDVRVIEAIPLTSVMKTDRKRLRALVADG